MLEIEDLVEMEDSRDKGLLKTQRKLRKRA